MPWVYSICVEMVSHQALTDKNFNSSLQDLSIVSGVYARIHSLHPTYHIREGPNLSLFLNRNEKMNMSMT